MIGVLTLVYNAVGIVEVNAVVAVWEDMNIVVCDAGLIKLVKQL